MGGRYNEPGSPPQPEGRDPGGPAHRDGPLAEHREDAGVPLEARRDDVGRDREGHRAAAAGGQHRDAGAPPPEMGRQAGHQEGGQGPSRALVPAQRLLARDPGADRPRGAVEDRPHRGEPQEAQDVRVGRNVRTPSSDATRTASAIPRNNPCPTTPGIVAIRAASFEGALIGPNRASRRLLPLSVRTVSASRRRSSTVAPRPSNAAAAVFQPNGWTSTGTGAFVPSRGTSFDASTITMNRFDAAATIFSRNSAPPRPLIRSSFGSTSSAPSTHRSTEGRSSSEVSGIPSSFAASAVANEVGTPLRSTPSRTSRATPSRKNRAVEPVPSPRTMPGLTYASAASAAFRFNASLEGMSRPPSQFVHELHELVDHEPIEFLAERLRRLRRIAGHAGPILPWILDDRVRRDLVPPGRARALDELGPRGQDAGGLARARVAVAIRQQPRRRVDDVVIREDRRLEARALIDDVLRGGPERHHVLSAGVAADDHHAAHAVPDERLQRVDGHAHGARIRPRRRAHAIRDGGCDERPGAARDLPDDVKRLDHVRPERQMPAVLLERADRHDDDGIRARERRELLGRHLVESHAAESTGGP